MNDTIIAWKNGVRKVWTRKQWDILGTDKYGWVEEPELPKEVAVAIEAGAPLTTTNTAIRKKRK